MTGARRIVITGMGTLAPNGRDKDSFCAALRNGTSGIKALPSLGENGMNCQVGGIVEGTEALEERYFTTEQRFSMNPHLRLGCIAGLDCWRDAGMPDLSSRGSGDVDWDTGAFIGTRAPVEILEQNQITKKVEAGQVRRIGSTLVEQVMLSSVVAKLSGLLGIGGQCTAGTSACTTGVEAIVHAARAIRAGRLKRAMAGSVDGVDPASAHHFWKNFDTARMLARGWNDQPEKASRPMSASARGFVPASGAAILMLEELESALSRGATIYAEVTFTHLFRAGSSPELATALTEGTGQAGIELRDFELISGFFLGNVKLDSRELEAWKLLFGPSPASFPWVNATKSLTGHMMAATGAVETAAMALQLRHGFIHGSANVEDLAPDFLPLASRIPGRAIETPVRGAIKVSYAHGDLCAAIGLSRWNG